ncbi:hypothetical protein [Marichromatium bheemlicum]|uniref:Secreted protein n=1 Tax=Marichromatium bheemlicum TaxID=365339 RepID=A0ABX1I2R7_9GAMM|nr:hypothetical protein [Marichromatium bheemlicum]NKN31674.1 hypothetical protein [Marichromatium bheemlicum]
MSRWVLPLLATLAWSVASVASDWRASLDSGGEVRVESDTRRAWVEDGTGGRRPLWDGVHRLEDGSVVIVRDGTVVPSAPMLQQWSAGKRPAREAPPQVPAECDALVEQVCGPAVHCLRSEACRLALELRALAQDEARVEATAPAGRAQCREALANALFGPCDD